MASRVGMALRNERAGIRIEAAIEELAKLTGVELPARPVRRRNQEPGLKEMLLLEWQAEVLETLADARSQTAA